MTESEKKIYQLGCEDTLDLLQAAIKMLTEFKNKTSENNQKLLDETSEG